MYNSKVTLHRRIGRDKTCQSIILHYHVVWWNTGSLITCHSIVINRRLLLFQNIMSVSRKVSAKYVFIKINTEQEWITHKGIIFLSNHPCSSAHLVQRSISFCIQFEEKFLYQAASMEISTSLNSQFAANWRPLAAFWELQTKENKKMSRLYWCVLHIFRVISDTVFNTIPEPAEYSANLPRITVVSSRRIQSFSHRICFGCILILYSNIHLCLPCGLFSGTLA